MLDDVFAYNGANTLAFVIFAFLIGIVLACALMLWQIKVPGRLVRALIAAGANAPERAIGAEQLGMHSERTLRFLLKDTGALSKYVRVLPVKQIKRGKRSYPEYMSAKYYLAPQTEHRAALRYEAKRASVPALIAAIVFFSILAVVLLTVIPDLLQMLNNFLEIIGKPSR